MKFKLTFFLLSFVVLGIAQPQLKDFQQFSREVIKKQNIKVIKAFEKQYQKPYYDYKAIIIPDTNMLADLNDKGSLQFIEEYDGSGRIIRKENFFKYSDLGHVKYYYRWDNNDRIQSIEYFKDTALQVKEEFVYDILGNMVLWKVRVFEQNMILFKKYENDEKGNPIRINIFVDKDKVREDSVSYVYDQLNRIVKESGYDQYGTNIDNIEYTYNTGDTLKLKQFYVSGKREKTELLRENKRFKTFKRVQYSDGDFMGTSYTIYNKQGNIAKEKNIHHYSQLNFEKKYTYTRDGLPLIKKVFKNGKEPETLVTFEIEYRDLSFKK